MKDVKILTFHNAENYGATLQAYALKETLKKIDTNPSFVNYINKDILKDYKLFKTNSIKSLFSSIWYLPRNLKRKKSFKFFTNKYLDGTTKPYYTKQEIEQDIKEKDVYIAGSDQIFNPQLTNGLSDVYTLNFKNNDMVKIVYGASVGNEELLDEYKKDFKEKLQNTNLISVREKNVAITLSEIIGKDVEKVLDPTLLLNNEEWNELILSNNELIGLENEKYILVYTLFENPEITRIANWLSEKTGLKVIHFRKYNAYKKQLMSLYTKGPVNFINAFKNAEYVITNSFHGLVFSVMFERKFFALMPSQRGGRLKDLIDLLGLEKRAIEKLEDLFKLNIYENIDYIKVKTILNIEKEKSLEYLRKGINSTNV